MRASDSFHLTEMEETIFRLIPIEPKEITTTDLMHQYYNGKPPLHGRQIITGRVSGIMRKLSYTKSPDWQVKKSNRTGPIPIKLSRVPLKRKRAAKAK